jgi:methylated-DNA-[protein]-cysteine S-methyltransferase
MAKETGYDAILQAPFGRLGIRTDGSAVTAVDLLGDRIHTRIPRNDIAREACRQLSAYFGNPAHRFHLPLAVSGTPFQERVWSALRHIPSGRVMRYGELARRLETSARSVGGACRANPLPVIVPCHRVIARDGDGGYMGRRVGRALRMKRWLLNHEAGR